MDRLLNGLAEGWRETSALGRFCAGFQGDIGPVGASLPLRLAGGLHALVLTGRAPGLAAVYPPQHAPDAALMAAVWAALTDHSDFIIDWMRSPPQTNEVRRSAVLIAAANWIAARHRLPFAISELGASAGLNLMWDRFALVAGDTRYGPDAPALTLTPDWAGPAPKPTEPIVGDRQGVDLNPLDSRDPDQALRLCAYLWPDQPHRLALTRAAIAAQDAPVVQGDAIDWLDTRLTRVPDGHLHLICHTIAWQYFPPETQARGRAMIEAAGAKATPDTPLAWVRFEADGATPGAAITLRLWPGDQHIALGRACYHGRWVQWNAG